MRSKPRWNSRAHATLNFAEQQSVAKLEIEEHENEVAAQRAQLDAVDARINEARSRGAAIAKPDRLASQPDRVQS
jgi:hypothetical protein